MSHTIALTDVTSSHIFKPRARLLLQLGDQLIKNESIALVELIKNSYDADANQVIIQMNNVDNPQLGEILIEDDGYGMSGDIVKGVWLEPGSDFKGQLLNTLVRSPKYHRLPIGEKGIGRFGVHKLGNRIELTSKRADSREVFVSIDWDRFNYAKYLADVPIEVTEKKSPDHFTDDKTGTKILIKNLRVTWDRKMVREIKRTISALSSPFESLDSFNPVFIIKDKPKWLDGLVDIKEILKFSLFKFKATIYGDRLMEFEYFFTPWDTMTKLVHKKIDLNGSEVENFIFLEGLNDNSKIQHLDLSIYKIGPVKIEGYIFDLDSFILNFGISDKTGFKSYLKANGGIRVYRDGLRVYDYGEPENDWLQLDYRRFQQPTKAISNNLILGAVSIDRNNSSDLIEKTNREGFVENDAYKAFKNGIIHVLGIIENLRMIDKRRLKEFYGPTPKTAPVASLISEARVYVDKNVGDPNVRKKVNSYFDKIESDYKRVSETLLKAAGAGLSMSVVVHEVEKIIGEIIKVLNYENASDRALKLVEHLSSLIDGYAEIVRNSDNLNQNLQKVLKQAIFNTEYRFMAHNVTLVKPFEQIKFVPNVKIARSLLIGTIMNLFDNSIYWLEKKFKNSNTSIFQKKIFINLIEEGSFYTIIIADNGPGFSIPTSDAVEPFVSGKIGGMGLGLHIAREVLLSQGGKLSFPDNFEYDIPQEFHNGAIVALTLKK